MSAEPTPEELDEFIPRTLDYSGSEDGRVSMSSSSHLSDAGGVVSSELSLQSEDIKSSLSPKSSAAAASAGAHQRWHLQPRPAESKNISTPLGAFSTGAVSTTTAAHHNDIFRGLDTTRREQSRHLDGNEVAVQDPTGGNPGRSSIGDAVHRFARDFVSYAMGTASDRAVGPAPGSNERIAQDLVRQTIQKSISPRTIASSAAAKKSPSQAEPTIVGFHRQVHHGSQDMTNSATQRSSSMLQLHEEGVVDQAGPEDDPATHLKAEPRSPTAMWHALNKPSLKHQGSSRFATETGSIGDLTPARSTNWTSSSPTGRLTLAWPSAAR